MLLTTACGARSTPELPAGTREAHGRSLFVGTFGCNTCHPGGGQGVGKSLVGEHFTQRYPTDEALAERIRRGGGQMPPYPPERMSEQELQDVMAYIRWLNEQPR